MSCDTGPSTVLTNDKQQSSVLVTIMHHSTYSMLAYSAALANFAIEGTIKMKQNTVKPLNRGHFAWGRAICPL